MTIERLDMPAAPQGAFAARPVGCILHGSRSGVAGNPLRVEYIGTARYCQTNAAGLAWHATIGENSYAVHLAASQWGWSAREHSLTYLAVEFAQPTVDDAITDGQVEAFVAWWQTDVLPVWPMMTPLTVPLPAHAELPAGKRDGKTDTYPVADARNDELRRRIRAAWQAGAPGDDDAARMEARYQANAAALGAKRFSGRLERDFYSGSVLVCDGGVVTPDGHDLSGNIMDDWVGLGISSETLVRY